MRELRIYKPKIVLKTCFIFLAEIPLRRGPLSLVYFVDIYERIVYCLERPAFISIFTALAFAGLAIFVTYHYHEEGRTNAINVLSETYWTWPPELRTQRQAIMQDYGITEDMISPYRILGVER